MALTLDPRFVIELQPTRQGRVAAGTYRRRRLACLLLALTSVGVLGLGGRTVLADRGGEPASASTVSPASATASTYVVRPGDTLWSIAETFAGNRSLPSYVDDLIALNGGATIQAGQQVVLP